MGEQTISPKALEEALLKVLPSLLPNHLGTARGARVEFYDKFQHEADEYDSDLLKKYGEDLGNTLIFAGLFSAITSAFIIDVQNKLEPDFQEMNHALLKIVASAALGDVPTGTAAAFPQWNGPDSTIVRVQTILYSSLAASLLASLIAVLGKQWLNRYAWVDMRGSVVDRSRHRQRKMNGMDTWRFDLVMESVPLILQAALLLLGYALSDYLFFIDKVVASVIIGFAAFGLLFYLLIASAASLSYNCPFQTPFSLIIHYLVRRDNKRKKYFKRIRKRFNSIFSNMKWKWPRPEYCGLGPPRADDGNTFGGHFVVPMANQPVQPPPLFNKDTDWEDYVLDSDCIAWMYEISMDTDVIMAILRFIPEIVWHAGIRTIPLERLYDTLVECFDRSSGHLKVIPKLEDKAYLAAKALLHLTVQRKCIGDDRSADALKSTFDRHLLMCPKGYEGDSDLTSTLGAISCVFGDPGPMDWQQFSFTPTHHAWMGHILLYRAWDVLGRRRQPLPDDIKRFILHSSCSEHPPPTPVIADCVFIISLILEIPLHMDDLAIVNKSSEVGPRIDTIYEELGNTFKNPIPGNDAAIGAVINRALEALRLISRLCDKKIALKSYDLFHVVMGASVPDTHSEKKWEAARLAIYGAYRGGVFIPQVKDQEDTLRILLFLNHHFELAAVQGQDQNEPIRIALHALVCTPNPSSIAVLESFDPTDPFFVRGIRYALQDGRPSNLREAVLLFLPLICDQWFNTRSLLMNPKQMKSFCADWASAVGVEQTPDIKTAALTVLLEMINSPRWRPHVVVEKLGLLKDLKSFPDDFQPLRDCINNPDLVDAIQGAGNPVAIIHWVAILWLKYGELDSRVRDQLEAITKKIARNERGLPHFDASRSRIGKWRTNTASKLKTVKDALNQYSLGSFNPAAVALEEKVGGLQLAIGALDAIKREILTDAGAEV